MNERLSDRFLLPFVIPVVALLIIGALIWSMSRILLALPSQEASTFIALAAAAAVLLGSALAAGARRVRLSAFAPLVLLLMAAFVGGGVVAAVQGERAIGEEHAAAGGEAAEGEGGEAVTPDVTVQIGAQNIAFDTDTLTVPAGTTVGVEFTNNEAVPHNWAAYVEEGGEEIVQGGIITGPGATETVVFTAPEEPGEYIFVCDVHPTQMTGTLVVE